MMRLEWITFVFCVLLIIQCSNTAKILTLFPTPSKSHTILGTKLVEGLLKRGHHVTFVTPFKMDPADNLTHLEMKSIYEYKEKLDMDEFKETGIFSALTRVIKFTSTVNELFWKEPQIQKIIRDKPKYDAVIVLAFFNDAMLGLGPHLGVPTILFSCVGSMSVWNGYMANPTMVYTKNAFLGLPTDSFLGRLATVTVNMMMSFVNYQSDGINQGLLDKYLPNSPTLQELQKNVSVMLINSHVSIESARPYVPNMIQIGGFHVQEVKPLPEEFKKFLDDAKQGAILFSMGSNVKVAMIQQRDAILRVLGEMAPMRVIFKSELKHENVPKNVMVKSWVPQADILAHPNTKLFISHGGLGGNTESVYHGVPILGIPFFGDQRMNLKEAQASGYAVMIENVDLTEELFRNKLKEVLTNPIYTETVKRRSALMREQPVQPMENAMFWIEHVMKFGSGSHLKNDGAKLAWYQLYMVDIYIFYTVVLILLAVFNFYAIKLFVKLVKRFFYNEKSKKNKKVKKS